MRNITEVIDQLVKADPDLASVFESLTARIKAEDGYLAPELGGHRWKEAMYLLATHRPLTHPKALELQDIFNGTKT